MDSKLKGNLLMLYLLKKKMLLLSVIGEVYERVKDFGKAEKGRKIYVKLEVQVRHKRHFLKS